jgi:hypothetical protein
MARPPAHDASVWALNAMCWAGSESKSQRVVQLIEVLQIGATHICRDTARCA